MFFKRKPDPEAAVRRAIAHLQNGRAVQAEEAMLQAVQECEKHFGEGSPKHADALNGLASVLMNLDELPRAIHALRRACYGPRPAGGEDLKDRLTYEMNLGTMLEMSGKLADAEQVIRDNLAAREQFYGRDHPGYGFGMEPLVGVLLKQGKAENAVEVARELVRLYWETGHDHAADALVLQAEALCAVNAEEAVFPDFTDAPRKVVERVGEQTLARMDRRPPLASRRILSELAPTIAQHLGEAHPLHLNLLARAANLEQEMESEGDSQHRLSVIQRSLDIMDRHGMAEQALHVLQGLALAQGMAGDNEAALATYAQALERAHKMRSPAQASQTLRNWGLLLSELGRKQEAEPKLREAVEIASRSRDRDMLGRAQTALGIFLQHGGRPDEAKSLLESAVKTLEAANPDAVCARGHLGALKTGAPCGCGDSAGAFTEALEEFVLSRLPKGLLETFKANWTGEDFRFEVHLSRQPSNEELEHLNRVVENAVREFKQRIQNPR